jgi:ribokinase
MTAGRVCVVGSFMMDLAVYAPRRPTPGETLVGTGFETFLGGKGFNQAVAAARAGAATAMIGRVGADEFGNRFLAALDAEGIDRHDVGIDSTAGTGVGLPLIEPTGENSIVIVPRANRSLSVDDVESAKETIASAGVVLLQLELPVPSTVAAARIAKAAGAIVVLNPAPAVADLTPFAGLVDVLVPNRVEAVQLVGTADVEALQDRYGCEVVLTLGGEGVVVLDGAGAQHVAAHPVEVVDTVGAGDAFCGALGAALARGAGLNEAAIEANAAAALSVTCRGAEPSLPTAAAVRALLGG